MTVFNRDFANRKEKMNFKSTHKILKEFHSKEQKKPIPLGTQARIDIANYIKYGARHS